LRKLRVGSRGSRLALVQAHSILDSLCREDPEIACELEIIQTEGDRVTDRPLSRIGASGLFIKEIESALLDGRIDLAVHSMKDLPSRLAPGLVLAVTTERADPRDALVSQSATDLATLARGGTVATGSLRRRSQLLSRRPDLEVVDLRGNVPTRLEKFDRSPWEAIVLAGAGLTRLGLASRIRSYIPVEDMLPAVGQGALALETRENEDEIVERLAFLDHAPTALAVGCERAFLARLEGGCQVPIGAFAEIRGSALRLRGYVGSVDGTRSIRLELGREIAAETEGAREEARRVGVELAESMIAEGAQEIIRSAGERS
jgi:hydroxymethylbilane synthase